MTYQPRCCDPSHVANLQTLAHCPACDAMDAIAEPGGVHWYETPTGSRIAVEQPALARTATCATCLHTPRFVVTLIGHNPATFCVKSAKMYLARVKARSIGWFAYGSEVPA